MIRELEEKLMKIGFRFEDSDFTAQDVRISELDINDKTKAFLDSKMASVETIGDLSLKRVASLKHCIHDGDFSVLVDLKNAMEEYGVNINLKTIGDKNNKNK